jgi:hypothetical protein
MRPSVLALVPLLQVRTAGAVLALLASLPVPHPVGAQELHVDGTGERLVRFVSQAPLEDFDGVTEAIDGFLLLPGGLQAGSVPSGSRVYLEVDLATIDTGISLRNRHMRDNYLHTDRFPYATYSAEVSRIEEPSPGTYVVSARGILSIHGVDRERTLECRTEDAAPPHRVRCAFTILLSDHDIEIPRLMFMKVADQVELSLEFILAEPR